MAVTGGWEASRGRGMVGGWMRELTHSYIEVINSGLPREGIALHDILYIIGYSR